jgi:O-antigen/teichoic acid export membrane protein
MGVASRIATVGLSFLVTLLLARELGAEGFGLYAFAVSIAAILGRLVGLGLPELIIRLTASAEDGARTATLRGVLRFALIASLALSTLLSAGYLLAVGANPTDAGFWSDPVTWAILLMVPLSAVSGNLKGVLNGLGRIGETIWLGDPLRLGIFLALIAGALWLIEAQPTPVLMLQLSVASSFFLVLILAQRMRAALARLATARGRTWHPRTWGHEAAALGLVGLITAGYQQADIIMLKWLAGPAEVGLYHVANRVSNLLTFFTAAAVIPLAPMLARHHAAGERAETRRLVRSSLVMVFALALVPALAMILLGPDLLDPIFGADYAAASFALQILAAGRALTAGLGILVMLLKMTGLGSRLVWPGLACLGVNLAGNTALIPQLGIEGAAVATAASWGTMLAWSARMAATRLGG